MLQIKKWINTLILYLNMMGSHWQRTALSRIFAQDQVLFTAASIGAMKIQGKYAFEVIISQGLILNPSGLTWKNLKDTKQIHTIPFWALFSELIRCIALQSTEGQPKIQIKSSYNIFTEQGQPRKIMERRMSRVDLLLICAWIQFVVQKGWKILCIRKMVIMLCCVVLCCVVVQCGVLCSVFVLCVLLLFQSLKI